MLNDGMQPAAATGLQFQSPATTSVDELVGLRQAAQALQRKVRKRSSAPLDGGSVSRRLGRGLDFAEVREYQPGDDVRMIDWKVTARSGRAHTKLFVEERERPVMLVIDCRGPMRFATRGMFKSVLAARLAALVGWSAVAANDRVGGFVIADDWHSEIRPQNGRRGLMALFRAVQEGMQRPVVSGGEQFSHSLGRLRHSVHGGSTVVIFSDFQGFDEAARAAVGSVLHSLDIVAVQVSDPLDYQLPRPGRYPMTGMGLAHAPWVMTVTGRDQIAAYRQQFEQRKAQLESLFAHNRHHYLMVSTSQPLMHSAANVLSRQSEPSIQE